MTTQFEQLPSDFCLLDPNDEQLEEKLVGVRIRFSAGDYIDAPICEGEIAEVLVDDDRIDLIVWGDGNLAPSFCSS